MLAVLHDDDICSNQSIDIVGRVFANGHADWWLVYPILEGSWKTIEMSDIHTFGRFSAAVVYFLILFCILWYNLCWLRFGFFFFFFLFTLLSFFLSFMLFSLFLVFSFLFHTFFLFFVPSVFFVYLFFLYIILSFYVRFPSFFILSSLLSFYCIHLLLSSYKYPLQYVFIYLFIQIPWFSRNSHLSVLSIFLSRNAFSFPNRSFSDHRISCQSVVD